MEKNTELLNTQTSAEKTDNQDYGTELVERKEMHGTPFIAINQGKGWFLAMGKYKVTQEHEKIETVRAIVKEANWELMTTVMTVIVTEILNEKNK